MSCFGCATTGDPSVDTIGFSQERAERERINPRQARLAEAQQGVEAERIRSINLKSQVKERVAANGRDEAKVRNLRHQIALARLRLAGLNKEVSAAHSNGPIDRDLITHRNQAQEQVDHLSFMLQRILQNE